MMRPIAYSAAALAVKQAFDQLPRNEKTGTFWESKDAPVVAIRSEIKEFYIIQQNYTCAYCKQTVVVAHHAAWDAEHVIPKSTHPQFMFEPQNLCISCKDCNGEKRNKNVLVNPRRVRFATRSADYLIAHPHYDEYAEHIRAIPNSLFFMPKTEKGKNTIEICGLLRFVLAYGEYNVDDTRLKKEIALRHDLLQNTNDQAETMFLIAELEELMSKLKQIAREVGIKEILKKRGIAAGVAAN